MRREDSIMMSLAALGMMREGDVFDEISNLYPRIPLEPHPPIPPSGCKTYWFKSSGDFSSDRMLRSEVVFTCFAINDKNAKRKFDKWNQNKQR